MAQMLQSRVKQSIRLISSLLLFWVISGLGYAQTTLLPGDLMILTVNSTNSGIELVPVIDLESETTFEITAASHPESKLKITLNESVPAGNILYIGQERTSDITIEGELLLNSSGDQILVTQPDIGIERPLFVAVWGQFTSENVYPHGVPFVQLGAPANHQYHLKNGASGTSAMIKDMIADPSHWKSSDTPFTRFRTAFKILAAPVVLFDQNISTVMEGDSIPLNVAIYGHDGSRLTVDVILNEAYSTADSNDVLKFEKFTYNFTGLIGDAVYEIAVSTLDDDRFEDRETAFFELENLSGGNFGDFVSHAAFIQDNEVPDVLISSIFEAESREQSYIEIQNNEKVYVNISGWSLNSGSENLLLGDVIELAPFERRRLTREDFILNIDEGRQPLFGEDDQIISMFDVLGNEVDSYRMESNNRVETLELTEAKVELPNALTFEINPLNTSGNIIEQGAAKKTVSDQKKLKPGWYPTTLRDFEAGDEQAYFWKENAAEFAKITTENQDSVSGALFHYLDFETQEFEFEIATGDSTTITDVAEPVALEWGITLSATDIDGNGVVNDNEGYNFVEYRGTDSISVNYLITTLEYELGKGYLFPGVFGLDENGTLMYKGKEQKLYPGEFLWLKADSLFERQELVLATEVLISDPYFAGDITEAVSKLQISLSTATSLDFLNINFFEEGVEKPRSVLEPVLDLKMALNELESPVFGGYHLNNWNSTLNLDYTGQTVYQFPLGILFKQSGELSIGVTDWNMEGGWRLFIEDKVSGKRSELLPGIDFSFEYSRPESVLDDGEEAEAAIQQEVFSRYSLMIASPEYVEAFHDQPEQIALNQNYPNPFNPETTISFYLPESVEVKLSVFNVVGQPISVLEEGFLNAGEHQYLWNAAGFPSGMYIYQLEVGNKVMTRKMTLVK